MNPNYPENLKQKYLLIPVAWINLQDRVRP